MLPDHQLELVRKRAYELYLSRNPQQGSPEEDWLRAEEEIQREEGHDHSHHVGPARLKDPSRWNEIGNHRGEDIENPA
jgi:hypothetical protein